MAQNQAITNSLSGTRLVFLRRSRIAPSQALPEIRRGYTSLAAAVYHQALLDARKGDTDAAEWLEHMARHGCAWPG